MTFFVVKINFFRAFFAECFSFGNKKALTNPVEWW